VSCSITLGRQAERWISHCAGRRGFGVRRAHEGRARALPGPHRLPTYLCRPASRCADASATMEAATMSRSSEGGNNISSWRRRSTPGTPREAAAAAAASPAEVGAPLCTAACAGAVAANSCATESVGTHAAPAAPAPRRPRAAGAPAPTASAARGGGASCGCTPAWAAGGRPAGRPPCTTPLGATAAAAWRCKPPQPLQPPRSP
jgi:hypothetical protein